MTNHQNEVVRKIDIREYGVRDKFLGHTLCGSGRHNFLHISDNPKKEHSAYRVLKLIQMMPYCTKSEILWATGGRGAESTHNYWSDLHRRGYVEQYRTRDNLIVYALTSEGESFVKRAK